MDVVSYIHASTMLDPMMAVASGHVLNSVVCNGFVGKNHRLRHYVVAHIYFSDLSLSNQRNNLPMSSRTTVAASRWMITFVSRSTLMPMRRLPPELRDS